MIIIIGSFLSWFIGSIDGIVKVLFIMVIVDYISGVMKAIATHSLSSRGSYMGIMHKTLIFLFVGIANVIDRELMGSTDLLRDGVCVFYISTEGISVFENAITLGMPIPDTLKDVFLEWRAKHQKLEDKSKAKRQKSGD